MVKHKRKRKSKDTVRVGLVSGYCFPDPMSRAYLPQLVKDIAERDKVDFMVLDGHTMAGKWLESMLKHRIKESLEEIRTNERDRKMALSDLKNDLKTGLAFLTLSERKKLKGDLRTVLPGLKPKELKKHKKLIVLKEEIEELSAIEPLDPELERSTVTEAFIQEHADAVNEFLPVLKNDVSYHIVISEKIFDRPIGRQILDKMAETRSDVRIHYDPETKFPIQLPGCGVMRAMVPRKALWFYDNQTGPAQRIVNSFSTRTFSPKPELNVVGCTGNATFFMQNGVWTVQLPTCHKIEEQSSVESTVGFTVVSITKKTNGKFRISPRFYDFRSVVFKERDLVLPKSLGRSHNAVIEAMKPGSASTTSIRFRINHPPGKDERSWSVEKTQKCLDDLVKLKLVNFNKKGNRYEISLSLVNQIRITLGEFSKGSHGLTQVVKSCWHVGALKGLNHTVLHDEPILARDADVIILNGDIIQGISHNYEYNGEMMSDMNGVDKQEMFAAAMQADIMMRILRYFYKIERRKGHDARYILENLITLAYKHGNHDEPRFSHSKNSAPLMLFDTQLRSIMKSEIKTFFERKGVEKLTQKLVDEIVKKRIVRIGESRMTKVKGIAIGVKHPFQARTKSNSARTQEVVKFFPNNLKDWADKTLKEAVIFDNANFHVHGFGIFSDWGVSRVGVMTGAQIADSSFESNLNKVVEHGLAKNRVCLNAEGKLIWTDIEYFTDVADEDKKIVFADNLTNKDVVEHEYKLAKRFNVPWR